MRKQLRIALPDGQFFQSADLSQAVLPEWLRLRAELFRAAAQLNALPDDISCRRSFLAVHDAYIRAVFGEKAVVSAQEKTEVRRLLDEALRVQLEPHLQHASIQTLRSRKKLYRRQLHSLRRQKRSIG